MLEAIRNATKTWIAKVILAIITVPFALWGIESYIKTPTTLNAIATVGEEKIGSAEFNDAVRGQLEQYKRQFGPGIDASIMDNPQLRQAILDQLIDQRLFAKASQVTGVKVSDAALRDRIATETLFQEGGKFMPARYETFLKANGETATMFEAKLRKDMERQQFANSIANTGITPQASVAGYLRASEQSREVAMVNITPDQFKDQVKITPAQVKAYYDTNQSEFSVAERVKPAYVELSIDALTPTVQVTPEEIAGFYETNKSRYVQKKEERKASHILINAATSAGEAVKKAAKAKADDLFAQLKKNIKVFPELAKTHSQDPGSGAQGGDLGFFGRGLMTKPFEEATFKAAKGELIGPVETEFGYHIILVTDIRPEVGKSLAEATPEVDSEIRKQKAQRKFAEVAEKFTNAAYEQSANLKAAAEVAGLTIRQGPWVLKGQGAAPPFNNPKLTQALFTEDVAKGKRNTEAIEIAANTLVAARVLEHTPMNVRPFSEVENAINQKLVREEAGKLAKKDGQDKLAALQAGKTVDLKWPSLLAVSRNNPGGLPPPVIDAAMKLQAKTLPAYTGTENPGGGFSLIQVAKMIEAPAADEAKLKATRSRVAQALSQQEMMSILAQVRTKVEVTIAKDALEKKDK